MEQILLNLILLLKSNKNTIAPALIPFSLLFELFAASITQKITMSLVKDLILLVAVTHLAEVAKIVYAFECLGH